MSQDTDAPSLDEVYSPRLRPGDYEPRRPIPESDPKCPNCGYGFDSDEWDERHLHGGPSKTYRGGSAKALVDADPEDYPR